MTAPAAPVDYTQLFGTAPGAGWQQYGSYSAGTEHLSPQTILQRMQDAHDAKRKRDIDALATQAQAGDPTALARIQGLADFSRQDKVGAATADGVNYARYVLGNLTGQSQTMGYLPPSDGQGFRNTLSTVLKVAAPIAGALIPGVGLLGAAAIGGLGNAAGQYVGTGHINLGQTLAAGGMAAAGNGLLGNGLGSGGSGLIGSTAPGVAATGPNGWGGDATMAGGQGGGGLLGNGGILGTGLSTKDAIGAGLGLLGTVDAAKQSAAADALRQQAVDFAVNDYNQRAPARTMAMQRVLAPVRSVQNRANPFTQAG